MIHPTRSFPALAALLLLIHPTTATQCYFTDGTKADNSFQPCYPDQENSPCCANNKAPGMPNDICLSSGFCLAQMAPHTGLIYQNGCTEKDWNAHECPTICSGPSSHGIKLLPCPAKGLDQWCCSINGTDCCEKARAVDIGTIIKMRAATATGTGTATTATTTATVTTTSMTTTTVTTNGTEGCTDSKTTAVGAGVGAGLGACLVAALSALWFQRRLYLRRLKQDAEYTALPATAVVSAGARQGLAELHSDNSVHEIGAK